MIITPHILNILFINMRTFTLSLIIFLLTLTLEAKEDTSTINTTTEDVTQLIGGGCADPTSEAILDIGNVRTRILGGGDMWWDLTNAQYEVPKDEGVNSSSILASSNISLIFNVMSSEFESLISGASSRGSSPNPNPSTSISSKLVSGSSLLVADKSRRNSPELNSWFSWELSGGSITAMPSPAWGVDMPNDSSSKDFGREKIVKESLRKRYSGEVAAFLKLKPQLPQFFSCLNAI